VPLRVALFVPVLGLDAAVPGDGEHPSATLAAATADNRKNARRSIEPELFIPQ